MMIKIFTTNKSNKIELTKEELKQILDEAYWEGYRAKSNSWTYTSPSVTPYIWTSSDSTSYTLTCNSPTAETEGESISNITYTTNTTDTPTI